VAEPLALGVGNPAETPPAEKLEYTYPGGPRDVEAMYVATDASITLISKRPLRNTLGVLRPALVFRISAEAWREAKPVVACLTDSLPIVPGSARGRLITDAALAPDSRHVAVRTYTQVFVFAVDSATGLIGRSVAADDLQRRRTSRAPG